MQRLWQRIGDQSRAAQFYGVLAIMCERKARQTRLLLQALDGTQTYKDAILEPGPRLNLVLGPNGELLHAVYVMFDKSQAFFF